LQFIDRHRDRWPVTVMCRVLDVTASAFYPFAVRSPSAAETRQAQITKAIETIHGEKHHDAYGSPRMHRELIKRGIECCRGTVAKCMKRAGITANRRTKFRISTTDSNHDQPIAPNLLEQNFETQSINEVWLTDITYIPTAEGFTYLAAIVDLHSRKIIGWKTSRNIDSSLVVSALRAAITFHGTAAIGVIIHSDRGSQYASGPFRDLLVKEGLIQTMSRRGNCYDNAPMESFFKSYKTESVGDQLYATHEQATRAVSDYIDGFYNPTRLHSSLDYQSPIDFEQSCSEQSTVEAS